MSESNSELNIARVYATACIDKQPDYYEYEQLQVIPSGTSDYEYLISALQAIGVAPPTTLFPEFTKTKRISHFSDRIRASQILRNIDQLTL